MLDTLYNKAKQLKEVKRQLLDLSRMLKDGDDIPVSFVLSLNVHNNILEDCNVPKRENLNKALNYTIREDYEAALQYLMPCIAYITKSISNLVYKMKEVISEFE